MEPKADLQRLIIKLHASWRASGPAGRARRCLFLVGLLLVLYAHLSGCGYEGWGATGVWLDSIDDCRDACCCANRCVANVACEAWQFSPADAKTNMCFLKQAGILEPNDGSIAGEIHKADWLRAQVGRLVLVAILASLYHCYGCPAVRLRHCTLVCKVILPTLLVAFVCLQVALTVLRWQGASIVVVQESCSEGAAVCRDRLSLGDAMCPRLSMPDLSEVVAEVKDFFALEQQMDVYPWDLSLVAALRFGGLGLECKEGGICMAASDLDFAITADGQDQQIVKQALRRLVQQFRSRYIVLDRSQLQAIVPSFTSDPAKHRVMLIGPRVPWSRPMGRMLKRSVHSRWKRLFLDVASPLFDQSVILDFHIKNMARTVANSPGGARGANRVQFEGQSFTLPFAFESDLAKEVARLPERARHIPGLADKIRGLCDLQVPKGIWPEDEEVSADPKIAAVTKSCGEALQRKDYLSFTGLCGATGEAAPR